MLEHEWSRWEIDGFNDVIVAWNEVATIYLVNFGMKMLVEKKYIQMKTRSFLFYSVHRNVQLVWLAQNDQVDRFSMQCSDNWQ